MTIWSPVTPGVVAPPLALPFGHSGTQLGAYRVGIISRPVDLSQSGALIGSWPLNAASAGASPLVDAAAPSVVLPLLPPPLTTAPIPMAPTSTTATAATGQ